MQRSGLGLSIITPLRSEVLHEHFGAVEASPKGKRSDGRHQFDLSLVTMKVDLLSIK